MEAITILTAFVLFAVANSVSTASDQEMSCMDQGVSACFELIPSESPGFPRNEETLNQVCDMAIAYSTCMKELSESCTEIGSYSRNPYEGDLRKLHVICDKDSKLYKDIVQHIECFRVNMLNHKELCGEFGGNIRESGLSATDHSDEDYDKFGCLGVLMDMTCVVTKIKHSCSAAAEDTALDVLKIIIKESNFCPGSSIQEAADLVPDLDVDAEIKTQFRKLLPESKPEFPPNCIL